MLQKKYSKKTNTYYVTFQLSSEAMAKTASVCGEFNDWDKEKNKMRKLKNGGFTTTLQLAPAKTYRFRYWLDGTRWDNDWEADGYAANEFGSEDSLVVLGKAPSR